MNKLYASIKKSSEYYHQTPHGETFPVFIEAGKNNYYRVKGGPGGAVWFVRRAFIRNRWRF